MELPRFVLWVLGAWLLLRGIGYLLAARIYLTSAIQQASAWVIDDSDVPTSERALLSSLDAVFATLGFKPAGFLAHSPALSYYGATEHVRVLVHVTEPITAAIYRRFTPEYGRSVEFALSSELLDGRFLVSDSRIRPGELEDPDKIIASLPAAAPAQLLQMHEQRLGETGPDQLRRVPASLAETAADLTKAMAVARALWRTRRWTVPSVDPQLDRITLRGAFALVSHTRRAFGAKGTQHVQAGEATAANIRDRVTAEVQAIQHVAVTPRMAPGVPWPLLILSAATAIASLLGMAALWNGMVAVMIFAVLVIHEGGHALVMRAIGHTAVHVFFVPLLGAFTVGREVNRSVRGRVAVLLGGPLPGLLLGLAMLRLFQVTGQRPWAAAAFAFIIINGLNLLPFSPLDGGRILEALTRPEGWSRLIVQLTGVAGLCALALALHDPVIGALAFLGLVSARAKFTWFRFRQMLAARVADRADRDSVIRAALELMTLPRHARLRAPQRQTYARNIADEFAAPPATLNDRVIGVLAYSASIVVGVYAFVCWARVK